MAGGKPNTTRIEDLEKLTSNLVAQLNVHDETLKWISEMLKKQQFPDVAISGD